MKAEQTTQANNGAQKPNTSVPAKPSACATCGDEFPDGQPAACLRTYDTQGPSEGPAWKFTWVCRQCLAKDWRYA